MVTSHFFLPRHSPDVIVSSTGEEAEALRNCDWPQILICCVALGLASLFSLSEESVWQSVITSWRGCVLSKETAKMLEVSTYKSHLGNYALGNPQTQAALGLCSPSLTGGSGLETFLAGTQMVFGPGVQPFLKGVQLL